MSNQSNIPAYAKASLISIGILAFLCTMYLAKGIIVPLIYATIISIVLSPVVDFLVRKKIKLILAITITLLILIIVSTLCITLLLSQASLFSESLPKLLGKWDDLFLQSEHWISNTFNISQDKLNGWTTELNNDILSNSSFMIGITLMNVGNILIILFLIPVYIFMILYYRDHILEFIHKLFSANKLNTLNEVLNSSKKIIQSYLVGLLLEALIIATLNSCSLLIIGINYAILLGVLGAIINVIPFIGGIVAVAMPMAIALITKSPSHAFFVLEAYLLIQFTDNHFIIPKVVASKVKLNALVSIIVVLLGGAIWGIPGMFLSIPMVAILKVIFDRIDGLKPWGFLLGNVVSTKPINILTKRKWFWS